MTKTPETHLGHYIGPAPTNAELGIGTTHDIAHQPEEGLESGDDKGSDS